MWGILGMLAAVQVYAVQELLAALALFALGFLAIVLVVAGLYTSIRHWWLYVKELTAWKTWRAAPSGARAPSSQPADGVATSFRPRPEQTWIPSL